MGALLTILNMFSGPIGSLVEKAILSGVMYLFAAGKISGDAAGVAAAIYGAFSAIYTAMTSTQGAKMKAINADTNNGAVVVDAVAARRQGITPIEEPRSSTFGG